MLNKIYFKYQEEIIFLMVSILPFSVFLGLDYFLSFEPVIWGAFTFGLSIIMYLLSSFVFEREISSMFCKLLVVLSGCFFAFSMIANFKH